MKSIKKVCALSVLLLSNSCLFAQLPDYLDVVERKTIELTKEDYTAAKLTAINNPQYLGDFTSHMTDHILMVADKSFEIINAFDEAIERKTLQKENTFSENKKNTDKINFGKGACRKTLIAASIFHDSGMKSGGFVIGKDGKLILNDNGKPLKAVNGNDVRSNHALNSAINVLIQRDELVKLGVDVDFAALLCFAHSKSSSGIKNLSRKSDWISGFDRLSKVVEAYNAEHKKKISLNCNKFEKDETLFEKLVTAALTLRLGDVSRDSKRHAVAQNGGEIVVYHSTVNNMASDAPGEAKNAKVYNYRTGYVKDLFSRQVHVGEQNDILNRTVIDEKGKLFHEITIEDGNYAPHATFQNIIEHAGELESAPDADIKIKIYFKDNVNEYFKHIYEDMRKSYSEKKAENAVSIIYLWDK